MRHIPVPPGDSRYNIAVRVGLEEEKGKRRYYDKTESASMADLHITEYAAYDEFAREWDASDSDTRLLWQLLGQLEDDELLIEIPEWLAEEKVGFVDGATPTLFVGRIEHETEKAMLVADSAAARPVMKRAHRIHRLAQNESGPDRNEWLDDRLETHCAAFEKREGAPGLADEWLPKSQLHHAVRRP